MPNIFWLIAMAVASAIGVYQLKYAVIDKERELYSINQEIAHEKETLHVLKAEWSYLTNPERISRLSEKFLELEAINARKIVSIESIPMRTHDSMGEEDREENAIVSRVEGLIPSSYNEQDRGVLIRQ